MFKIYQKVLEDDISDINNNELDYNLYEFFDFLKKLKIDNLKINKKKQIIFDNKELRKGLYNQLNEWK